MSKVVGAFLEVLGSLRTAGFPLLLLRERGFDPATATSQGDYDFLAPDGELNRVLELWHEAILETPVCCRVECSKGAKRHLVFFDPDGDLQVHVDLWREHLVDIPLRVGQEARLLRFSTLRPHCVLDGNILRMAQWLEALVYFAHLFEKEKDPRAPGVVERLRFYAARELSGPGCPAGLPEDGTGPADTSRRWPYRHTPRPVRRCCSRRERRERGTHTCSRRAGRWAYGKSRPRNRRDPLLYCMSPTSTGH